MESVDYLKDEDLYTCDTANYALVAVVVVGLPLVVALLYKVHVDHRHKQEKEQAYRDVMEEYQKAKSGQAANLQREVIATRMESETQRMKLEENEQTLRQRHKQETRELEKKHRQCERELEATQREIDRQKQDHLEKEGNSQRRIRQLEWELNSLKKESKESESRLEKQCQSRVQEQVEAYEDLSAKYAMEVRRRDATEAVLKDEKTQLEDELFAKSRENKQLQKDLEQQEIKLNRLQEELRKSKEEPKKGLLTRAVSSFRSTSQTNADTPSFNQGTSRNYASSHESSYQYPGNTTASNETKLNASLYDGPRVAYTTSYHNTHSS